MSQRIIFKIIPLSILAVVSTISAFAQHETSYQLPISNATNTWQAAQLAVASKDRLDVVAVNQPNRRHSCRIQSFTPDKLVCSSPFGGTRTYLLQQVSALIIPGDNGTKIRLVLGLNGALGTAVWGAVVLAATCPICAAAVSFVALVLFGGAGAVLIGDDQPDRLLYLATGEQLSAKLGYIQR